jgi:hypothetical protein
MMPRMTTIGEAVESCENDALGAAHRMKLTVNPHKVDRGGVTLVLINVPTMMTDDPDDHHKTAHDMIGSGAEIRVDELTIIAIASTETLQMIETIDAELCRLQTIQLPRLI